MVPVSLDGEPAGDWHIEHRDRLQRQFIDGLMELGLHHSADDRHAKAAEVYRRVLARDGLHEDAALALMQSLAALGERAGHALLSALRGDDAPRARGRAWRRVGRAL